MKRVLITGTSSGLGFEAAKYFANNGCYVYATMRTPAKASAELLENENIEVLALDVEDQSTIDACRDYILKGSGLDILINNAGFGTLGTFEATTEEQFQKQFNVNVFGLMRVTQAFIPHFREKRSGEIINISSIAGRIPFPLTSVYNASKYAIEGFSEALQFELEALGIQVKIIEPGLINTNFAGSSMTYAEDMNIRDYNDYATNVMRLLMENMAKGSEPQDVAKAIFSAARDKSGKMRFIVGEDAIDILGRSRELGDKVFRRYFKKEYEI